MSIRLRIATWYGALSAMVVVLVCVYAYVVHVRTHYDELDEMLQERTEHIARMLAGATSAETRRDVLRMAAPLGIAVRLFDSSGATMVEQANADSVPDVKPRDLRRHPEPFVYSRLLAHLPITPGRPASTGIFDIESGQERWRTYLVGASSGPLVMGMASLATVDASVRRYQFFLLLLGLIGVSGTFIVGWLIAGHALRPVAQLTRTAHQIAQAKVPSRRVPVGREHDELGQLATTFNEMLSSLEAAHVAQQRFVSDASHEIRAPLTVIQANLELLERTEGLAAIERQQAVHEAHAEAERLTRLVADLLALARADAGVHLRRQPVELDRLLMEAIGEARHLLHGQRVEIAAVEPTTVSGDADRLKQLLLVLLDNAANYTPAGGRITVALERDDSWATISVTDTGIGIGPEDLGHVFERFYRADRARSREPGGTGLGLPIARWIATQHDGTLDLESAVGHGTKARMRLPLGISAS